MKLDKYFIRALMFTGICTIVQPAMGMVLLLALVFLLVVGHR